MQDVRQNRQEDAQKSYGSDLCSKWSKSKLYDGNGGRSVTDDSRQARAAARERPGKYWRLHTDCERRPVWSMQNDADAVRAGLRHVAERENECARAGPAGTAGQVHGDLPGRGGSA